MTGLCACGCGQKTAIARQSRTARGWINGQPKTWVKGHAPVCRVKPVVISEVDRGFASKCWICDAPLQNKGYAKRSGLVHRKLYVQHRGEIPHGLELDHLCRQTDCVNPWHLEAVTHAVNIQRCSVAKLTAEQVLEIRSIQGETTRAIGKRFGISGNHVSSIVRRRVWKDI